MFGKCGFCGITLRIHVAKSGLCSRFISSFFMLKNMSESSERDSYPIGIGVHFYREEVYREQSGEHLATDGPFLF